MSGGGVYVCSRTHHAGLWKEYRAAGVPIIASWINEAGAGETENFGVLWERIRQEVLSATHVIVFACASDFPLKGALVEAGMAIAAGKPIHLVLARDVLLEPRSCRPIGSWINHPLVKRFESVEAAFAG